ncbi:serine protease [Amylostereum chailletii]|nr:serine protease [Amylostereum chailletii]
MAIIEISRTKAGKTSGRHIIHLKETAVKSDHLSDFTTTRSGHSHATHVDWDSDACRMPHSVFDDATLEALRSHPDVKAIEEDGALETCATQTQTNAPWGLSRISKDGKVQGSAASLNYQYKYDSSAGNGVDIYIMGINTTHVDFGGRAKLGAVFGSGQNVDDYGHGTHVAGTAGGTQYGVAKAVTASSRPSVVNMSLGTDPSGNAVDAAVNSLVTKGIHVVVAAGNDNSDARNYSPARVPSAITVGSMDITDTKRASSNWGPALDIFAPGGEIISAWIGSNTATNSISGTSMARHELLPLAVLRPFADQCALESQASPHVAGLIAYFISKFGNKDVASMTAFLKQYGIKNAIAASTLRALHLSLFVPLLP